MQVAIIGLGRMGKNIALHLLEQGVEVVVYNRSRDDIDELVGQGASGVYTLTELPKFLTDSPKVVLLYIPAGAAVDEILFGARGGNTQVEKDLPRDGNQPGLVNMLPPGAIIIDGGNSDFKHSQRRYSQLKEKGFYFLDMGTSGGLEGARNGACLMVGGDAAAYKQVELLLTKIATPGGLGYFGSSGAGHYVKMVHNAIEYGMMGSIAEGLNLIKSSQFKVNLASLTSVWGHGSIVSGLLMNKTVSALTRDPELNSVAGEVPVGATEKEVEDLERMGQPMPVIQASRLERVESRNKPSFIGKVIAALRREFGGHAVKEN